MQHCTRCGAAAPDDALSCQRCGQFFNRGKQQKKQRSFLASLLLLFGIRRNPQTGSLGCAPVPATISVALVAAMIIGVTVGPVLKLIPPFAPGLTIVGNVVPGSSVLVNGTNFPAGSRINLTLDGVSISLAPNSRHSISQSLYDISLSAVQMSPLQQTEQPSSPASTITVRDDGTFDAQISIPKNWQPNSQHIIRAQAIGQDGSVQTQVQQTVTIPGQVVALSNTTPSVSGGTPTATPSTPACSTGTVSELKFSFSGAAPNPMCVVRHDYCAAAASPSPGSYQFSVLGTVNGTLYTFMFLIGTIGPNGLQGYSGPGTYTGDGGIALIVGDYSKVTGPVSEWLTLIGTITVNGGETSGSVDALMTSDTSGTVHVTGNWLCS
jgi:predicted nucleic acid-binding Zn ribbon protein